jgi:Tfp pilus assembly protein PilP
MLVAFSVVLSARAQCASNLPPSDYCSCLQQGEHDAGGRRDGGPGFSIVVPANARKAESGRVEGDLNVVWKFGAHYSYLRAEYGSADLYLPVTARRCSYQDKGRRISIADYQDEPSMQASIPAGNGEPGLLLEVLEQDRASACRVMRSAIASAAFVNDWRRWKLMRIAKDRKSFDFRNEIGETRTVKLGDYVTKDDGRVSLIAPRTAAFTELEPNGTGGWIEWVRVLSLNRPPYTQSPGSLSRSGMDVAPSSRDYCRCLESPSPLSDVRYDGGLAGSFLVPRDARKNPWVSGIAADKYEERFTWQLGKSEIRYWTSDEDNRVPEESARYPYDHPEKNECVINTHHGRVSIEAIFRDGRQGLRAFFEEWPQPWHGMGLEILADKKSVCSWGAATIRSVETDANSWRYLAVLSVAPDHKSFLYRNKVGIAKRAVVGAVITKSGGRVGMISDSAVTVTEIEKDGTGGFKEVERQLPFAKR